MTTVILFVSPVVIARIRQSIALNWTKLKNDIIYWYPFSPFGTILLGSVIIDGVFFRSDKIATFIILSILFPVAVFYRWAQIKWEEDQRRTARKVRITHPRGLDSYD